MVLLPSTESAVADSCSTLQFRVKEVTLSNIKLLPTLTQIWLSIHSEWEMSSSNLLRPSTETSPLTFRKGSWHTSPSTVWENRWNCWSTTGLRNNHKENADKTTARIARMDRSDSSSLSAIRRAICILFLSRKSSARHIWKTDSALKTGLMTAVSYLVLFPIDFKHRNGAFAVDFITWWMFPNTFCLWQENKVRVTLLF